jgi:hypothetical protein
VFRQAHLVAVVAFLIGCSFFWWSAVLERARNRPAGGNSQPAKGPRAYGVPAILKLALLLPRIIRDSSCHETMPANVGESYRRQVG